jgi:hypothetical protein
LEKKLQNLPIKITTLLFLSQSGDQPLEDEEKVMIIPEKHLGKSGYKPYMKYKIVINLLYFWLHSENQI